ncbi:PA14 domain-containing protein [Nocardioides pakistanensis]
MTRPSLRALAVLAAAAIASGTATLGTPVSQALFTDASPLPGPRLDTDTLLPPTNARPEAVTPAGVTVAWQPSASSYATGYRIFRGTTAAGPFTHVGSVTGRVTTEFTDTTPAAVGDAHYLVRAAAGNWLSPITAASTSSKVTAPTTLSITAAGLQAQAAGVGCVIRNAAGTPVWSGGRSYNVYVWDKITRAATWQRKYDVYGNPAEAARMAADLNALPATGNHTVAVFTCDEPRGNRLSNGLDTAMYRIGASRAVFGATDGSFGARGAYLLVGEPGRGEGNPLVELQKGTAPDLATATAQDWVTATFTFAGATVACPTGQFQASYFADMTLLGDPAVVRCEESKAGLWATGSPPATAVEPDRFSVERRERADFAAGTYRFRVTSDDGVRVYLDNTLLVDAWRDQSGTTYTADAAVSAGPHTVITRWYENTGTATLDGPYWTLVP